jgi:hypothetical protein
MATSKTKGRVVDLPQFYIAEETEAGANAGVIAQVPSSINTRDKVGVLVHSLEMDFGSDPFAADADGITFGLTQLYNRGTIPGMLDPGVITYQIRQVKVYSSVGVMLKERPFRVVFDNPRLAHPAALYWFFQGLSQGAPLTANMRMEYSYVDLTDTQYQDIIQTVILQNAL